MGDDRFARLTPRQQQCLRLVRALKSTKEIAAELGIKPSTVNGYLDDAVAILGARDRRDAALKFCGADQVSPERNRGESIRFDAAGGDPLPPLAGSDVSTGAVNGVREESAHFELGSNDRPSLLTALPWSNDGKRNLLTSGQRLFWIAIITIGLVISLGSFVTAIEKISRIGWAFHAK